MIDGERTRTPPLPAAPRDAGTSIAPTVSTRSGRGLGVDPRSREVLPPERPRSARTRGSRHPPGPDGCRAAVAAAMSTPCPEPRPARSVAAVEGGTSCPTISSSIRPRSTPPTRSRSRNRRRPDSPSGWRRSPTTASRATAAADDSSDAGRSSRAATPGSAAPSPSRSPARARASRSPTCRASRPMPRRPRAGSRMPAATRCCCRATCAASSTARTSSRTPSRRSAGSTCWC